MLTTYLRQGWKIVCTMAVLLLGTEATLAQAPVSTGGAGYGLAGVGQPFDMTKVADNVYSFRFLVHRNMIVVTNAGVIVTDPMNAMAAGLMMTEIKKITDQPVKLVIYSHNHWDHIAGAGIFKRAGAKIVQHELAAKNTRPHPDVTPADETFSGEKHVVTLGDQVIELIYPGPSHGSGLVVMLVPKARLLHIIDVVTPQRTILRSMPDSFPNQWILALKKMEALDFDQIVPGHGPAVYARSAVTHQREYLEDLNTAVSAATKVIGNPFAFAQISELVKQDLRPRYGKWAEFDDWMEMNVERITYEQRIGW